ncbi:MAG: NAD(P)-binding domain-containing protein, partial [Chloroflexi bacterium]|nr:NAD(P)-binding domain-containing protein [Chloroflexota bacterium]
MRKQRTGIIGAGTVGTALASCLFSKGYDIAAVHSRTSASARRLAGRAGRAI